MSTGWPPSPADGGDPAAPGYAGGASGAPPPYPYPPSPYPPYPYPPGGYPAPPPQGPWPGPYPPPYPQPYPGYAAPSSTNGFAIASLVLGILWLYWVGSILAVVFGHIALVQTRDRAQGGRGMAVAGLVLGYVGLALLALVIIGAVFVGTRVVHSSIVTPTGT
ncbi:MAG: DUF4190 domain-containing protein [Candidatus Dormibacteria bacterium]